MPRLILQGGEGEQVFDLPKRGTYRIGRSLACDLQLEHESISDAHCELYVDPMMVMVTDLGSTNGTYVNGAPVQKAQIQGGQVLQVGGVALVLEAEVQSVAMPELSMGAAPRATTLENGAPCCFNHSSLMATMSCTRCKRMFCNPCVSAIGLVGAKKHRLCPICHNACVPYVWGDGESRGGFLHKIVNAFKKVTGRPRS